MKTIKHIEFLNITLKLNNFFNDLYSNKLIFKEYLRRIEQLSQEYNKYGFIDKNHMIGDIFEIFIEGFIHIIGTYPTIGITDYIPVKKSEDNGVDGVGIGLNNLPLTVQVKYRNNPLHELTSDDIKQFGYQSFRLYDVDVKTKTNMVIFTTASDLHWHTKNEVFDNGMRVINRNDISNIIDNNGCFWKDMITLINDTKIILFGENK